MNKNLFYNILYFAQYAGFIIATILVLIFQFTASQTIMVLSLVLYVVSFAILTFSEVVGVKELYLKLNENKTSNENSTQPEINAEDKEAKSEKTKDEELKEIKGKIRWGYAKAIMCAIISVFALLVLILF